MSIYHASKIVKDGIICCLDAASPRSYDGSSTVWNDLSFTAAIGTLINGPSFDSDNGGTIVFDGIDDYVDFGSQFTGISTFTLSFWYKYVTFKGANLLLGDDADEANTIIIIENPGIFFTTPGEGYQSCTPNPFSAGTWYNFVITRDSTNMTYYNDNQLLCQKAKLNNNINVEWLARGGSLYANIEVSSFYIYNRALTAQEIEKNYHAMLERFE